jgi:hypothetical protein
MRSARLGMPGDRENVVKLEADHSTVCKFGSSQADQDNLKLVKANIRDMYREALKKSKCLVSLPPVVISQAFDKDVDEPDAQLRERLAALPPPGA